MSEMKSFIFILLYFSFLAASTEGQMFGPEAAEGRFPYSVQIWVKDPDSGFLVFLCGGTIIDRRWVLTAYHCIVDSEGNVADPKHWHVAVVGGTIHQAQMGHLKEDPETYFPDKVIPYIPNKIDPMTTDVGLLYFKDPLPLGRRPGQVEYMDKIDLMEGGSPRSWTGCKIMGWGFQKFENDGLQWDYKKKRFVEKTKLSVRGCCLRYNEVRIADHEALPKKFFEQLEFDPYWHVLVEKAEKDLKKKDYTLNLKGDSGSPLVCTVGNKEYLVGVSSEYFIDTSIDKITKQVTGVRNDHGQYVRTDRFATWIRRMMADEVRNRQKEKAELKNRNEDDVLNIGIQAVHGKKEMNNDVIKVTVVWIGLLAMVVYI